MGLCGGGELAEGQWGVRSWEGIRWGEMPDIGDGEEGSKPHCQCVYLCNNLAYSSHVPQNLKHNKKYILKKDILYSFYYKSFVITLSLPKIKCRATVTYTCKILNINIMC